MPATPANLRRLLDANANRAREAMRAMEDAARFVLDDATLSKTCKQLRHDLASAIRALPGQPIVLDRDTPGDVGTSISTKAERQRTSTRDVVVAAGKRLSEALRSCEEFGKVIDGPFASRIEQLRYRGYEIEANLVARFTLPDPRKWRVCVLVSESLCEHHDWLDVARAALDGGAQCIQLREKSVGGRELLARAEQLVQISRERQFADAAIIINDRPDIAVMAEAHGVHLGISDLPIDAVRKQFGRSLLIGASTHNLREAKAAIKARCDYCGVGAMYPTTTKQRKPSGIAYLKRYLRDCSAMPHLAIGGVTPGNVDELVAAGCRAVAVSSVVCGAKRPDTIVRRLLKALPK
jgi:thiamine-phosphate pyrophosphorylase